MIHSFFNIACFIFQVLPNAHAYGIRPIWLWPIQHAVCVPASWAATFPKCTAAPTAWIPLPSAAILPAIRKIFCKRFLLLTLKLPQFLIYCILLNISLRWLLIRWYCWNLIALNLTFLATNTRNLANLKWVFLSQRHGKIA